MTTCRNALLVAAAAVALLTSCGSEDGGLQCRSGDFYLDGKEFTSCAQCSSDDCGFESNATQVCTYPNGVQECKISSGKVTARCGGESATIVISNGVFSCG